MTKPTFGSIIELWNSRYQEGMEIRGTDVRGTPDFLAKKGTLEVVFNSMLPVASQYIDLTFGRQNPMPDDSLCFLKRLYGKFGCELPPLIAEQFERAISQYFFLGVATDFISMNREFKDLQGKALLSEVGPNFFVNAIIADRVFKNSHPDLKNMATILLSVQWKKITPLVKDSLKAGFLKKPKFQSNFENVFYGGMLLPIMVSRYSLGASLTLPK